MQIKIIMISYFIPIRWLPPKEQKTTVGKDVEKLEDFYTVSGNIQ